MLQHFTKSCISLVESLSYLTPPRFLSPVPCCCCCSNRGCAFEEECINKETNLAYNGELITVSTYVARTDMRPDVLSSDAYHLARLQLLYNLNYSSLDYTPSPYCNTFTHTQTTKQANSVLPGGMKIQPYCCAASDSGQGSYKLLCNTASSGMTHSYLIIGLAFGVAFYTAFT